MADLTFVDSHNMVAYLEKSKDNADFAKIVNFLNASSIRYALTVSLTIYVSYIEQFWSTTNIKTVNNETQIRAKVDGKTIVITESSMRRDLHFDDEDGVTPLFATMLIQSQAVEGEGSKQPTESQHTPTTASPSHVEPIPTVASSSHPKKTQKHRKTKRKATEISQSSGPTTLVTDETVYEEKENNVERAATTATSLDAEQGSGNINRTQSTTIPNDPFPQRISSGGSPRRQDTILGDRPAQTRVLALENIKTAQDLEITNLNKRVKKLKKKKKSRTPQLKRRLFNVRIESSAEKKTQGRYGHDISTAELTTASVLFDMDVSAASPIRPVDDLTTDDITLAETLMKIKSTKDKGKCIMQEPKKPVKVKGKDQIEYDVDVAQRLQAELDKEARLE
ncbi:hypothetical protein Tco_1508157 [Tanacetum coccineum]